MIGSNRSHEKMWEAEMGGCVSPRWEAVLTSLAHIDLSESPSQSFFFLTRNQGIMAQLIYHMTKSVRPCACEAYI